MNLKKNGKVFTRKFVGTGPSPYEKRIYRAAVSQRLRNTALDGSEWSVSLPGHCTTAGKAPATHSLGEIGGGGP